MTNKEIFFEDLGCFGCSKTNAAGLGLRFFERDAGRVGGEVRIPPQLSGWPGMAHGGVIATVLDEFSCAAAYLASGKHAMTGEIQVRYEGPCPVDTALDAEAHVIDASHHRYLQIEATLRLAGQPVARSVGKFFRVEGDPPVSADPQPTASQGQFKSNS